MASSEMFSTKSNSYTSYSYYSVTLIVIHLFIVDVKEAFIKAQVNGHLVIATNNVLRVPYGSNIQMACKGHENVFWKFNSNKIARLENVIKINLTYTVDSEFNAIVRINNFGKEYRGFYTCSSSTTRRKLKKTLLIVRGEFTLLQVPMDKLCS